MNELGALLASRKVVVCCGAGGVGKTTTAAALGIAAAHQGRKVLVLTIDPARRLAQALGIRENGSEPAALPLDIAQAVGIRAPGEVHAWMLNPRAVFEALVRKLASSPAAAERILGTALFGHLSELVAGMQEYTAAEAVHELVASGRYDLVILDTPPSRNALDFLDAPGRLSRFLDERILSLFLPSRARFILVRKAAERVSDILGRIFGETFFREIQEFLSVSASLLSPMRRHADGVRALLWSAEATFLLVTTPEGPAVAEARFFRDRLAGLKLPFGGIIVNRSWAAGADLPSPPPAATQPLRGALEKLEVFANQERAHAARDRAFLNAVKADLARGGMAVAAPNLAGGLEDVRGLGELARALVP